MASLTLSDIQTEIFECCWPIGSIFITADNRNPNQIIKGAGNSSWERVQDRFLIGAGDSYPNGSTGGQATVTLTGDQIPSHTHNINSAGAHTHTRGTMNITGVVNSPAETYYGSPSGAFYLNGTGASVGGHEYNVTKLGFDASRSWTGETSSNGNHTHSISNTGGNAPHDNIPPYYAVNIWERIT